MLGCYNKTSTCWAVIVVSLAVVKLVVVSLGHAKDVTFSNLLCGMSVVLAITESEEFPHHILGAQSGFVLLDSEVLFLRVFNSQQTFQLTL